VLAIYAAVSKNYSRCLQLLLTLVILWSISTVSYFFGFAFSTAVRDEARWLIWSREYKTRVLAQPAPANEELRHIYWDGWGMFAQDFSVLLVFDPTDSLSIPARSGQSGTFNGIPCEVSIVRRMESHWYTVEFAGYVDESWDKCK